MSNFVTEFFDYGDKIKAVTVDKSKRKSKLSPGVYKLEEDKDDASWVFAKLHKKFEVPSILFGSRMQSFSKICRNAYSIGGNTIGAMFVGQKGCGKSQQAEIICNDAIAENGLPVIVIDKPYPKAVMEAALKAAAPCVVYIDEYEKLYKPEFRKNAGDNLPDENELLTLFSDKSLKGVMILITANRMNDLSPYIINRPERFLFRIEYKGADKDAIIDICKHHNLKKDMTEYIVEYAEDTNANVDTCITLAGVASTLKKTTELKEWFEYLNVIKPKKFAWVIYTQSGGNEGLTVEQDRKKIIIEHKDTKSRWEINADNYWRNVQYNRNYNCYALSGLGGASSNLKLGIMFKGPLPEDSDEDTITYFQLTAKDDK